MPSSQAAGWFQCSTVTWQVTLDSARLPFLCCTRLHFVRICDIRKYDLELQ